MISGKLPSKANCQKIADKARELFGYERTWQQVQQRLCEASKYPRGYAINVVADDEMMLDFCGSLYLQSLDVPAVEIE